MANYATLKAAINAVIKANGNKEITGTVLNETLTAMVNSLGANYQFAGVATPSTNPGTPDQNVVYLASQAGTYTNFNAVVLPAGIHLLLWNGEWSTQTFFIIDDEPTAGSNNLVKSGGVALIQLELSGISANHNYISELISNCAVWGTETIYLHQWNTTSVIVIPINSTDYEIVSDEAPTQYGYFSGYPIKEDSTYGISKSSSKELPVGTKFVALQFNNSALPTYLYVKQNNQYLTIGNSKELRNNIEKEVIDSASRIEETDFSIYKIANTGIGDNGEFVTLSGVQIIPIEYLGRGIDVDTDFNITYWCFYSQFTDGNGLGFVSKQVISSYVRKPTIPPTTKYIYFIVTGNGTYFNVSQNGTFEEKTESTEYILRGSIAKASYYGEAKFTLDGIYKTDGTIYGEAYWLHTPYINISAGDFVNARLISGSTDLCAIAFFDANNNIIDYVLTVDSTANYTRCYNAVAPAGVAYVSFGCFKSKVSDCSFCIYKAAQKSADSFKNTVLGFIGDSITYGYDDSADGVYNVNLGIAPQLYRPWPYNVAAKLNAKKVYNYGVSSATLIPASDSIKGWAADYVDCADEVDIMAVMIGINDALHNTMTPALYPLGEMSDRTTETFYGSLHILWQGLLTKYPPKNGKKLFCIMYPDFDNAPYWSSFKEAVYEVTEYYGIPICELNKELGISQNGDPSFQYWFRSGNNHSAHPSQNGADLFASVISNFINSHFAK